jgi:hypothetical protein
MQVRDRDPDRALVVGEARPDPPGEVRLDPADAERDPAVRRRPHVVDRVSHVGEARSVGPPDLLEPVRRR